MSGMPTLKRGKFNVLPPRRGAAPSDVPPGHVAVRLGSNCRRFIVPVTHLNHPAFSKLLEKAAKQYSFDDNDGPIHIPCDESEFEEVLRVVTRSPNLPPSRCRVAPELSWCSTDRVEISGCNTDRVGLTRN